MRPSLSRPVLAVLLTLTVGIMPAAANGVSARPANTWSSDGSVSASAAGDNGVVYLGGDFGWFGPRLGSLVAVDRDTREPLPWPHFAGGSVERILVASDGSYIAQGSFQSVGGSAVNGLVRLLPSGELDPGFTWSLPGGLEGVALAGDRLLVSRGFQSAVVDARTGGIVAGPLPYKVRGVETGPGGQSLVWVHTAAGRQAIVRLHRDTGAIEQVLFEPPPSLLDTITAIAAAGDQLFIATASVLGEIVVLDLSTGASRTLARLDPIPRPFPEVTRMLYHDGRLYLHGRFTSINNTPVPDTSMFSRTAAIDANTGMLSEWRPALNPGAMLAVDGDDIVFGSNRLVAVPAATGAAISWSLPVTGTVAAVLPHAGRLLIGGTLSGLGVVPRTALAAVTLPTGAPTAWAPQTAGPVTALAVAGARVFAVEGLTNRTLVEFDAVKGARGPLAAAIDGDFHRMAVGGGRLFVWGRLTAVDGQPRNGIAPFDLTTSPPTLESWTAPFAGASVTAMLAMDGAIVLAGRFPAGSGTVRTLVALDPDSGAPLPWVPAFAGGHDINGPRELEAASDRFFVRGSFTAVNGQRRPGLAAFDLAGRLLPWSPEAEPESQFHELAWFEDRLYLSSVTRAYELVLASGLRGTWSPEVMGGVFLPIAGQGLLIHGAAFREPLSFQFFPRIPALGAVAGLRASINGSSVTLQWSPLAGAERYAIEAGTAPGLANLARLETGSAAATFQANVPNGRYYVRVRGVNEGGPGPASNEIVIVVGPNACAAPPERAEGVQATVAGQGVTLSWQAPSGGAAVSGYAIDLVSGPGAPTTVARTTSTTFSGSAPPGSYAVAVRAENACGSSPPTAPLAVTIPATLR